MNCINCLNQTENPKFCSRSCAATYNNKIYKKRKKEWFCKKCNEPCVTGRKFCSKCRFRDIDKVSLQDVSKDNYSSSRLSRHYSRKKYFETNPKICKICGYDKHVEVCHIKPVKDFDKTELLSVVNHIDNLIGLCPNHHWELDNGQLMVGVEGIEPPASSV